MALLGLAIDCQAISTRYKGNILILRGLRRGWAVSMVRCVFPKAITDYSLMDILKKNGEGLKSWKNKTQDV